MEAMELVEKFREMKMEVNGSIAESVDTPTTVFINYILEGVETWMLGTLIVEDTTVGLSVVGASSDTQDEEEPYPTIKSDATIIEGAILAKFRNQIMDRPPSPNKVRDALESYRVDQLLEAIDRIPIVLKPKDVKTRIDGNYALSLAIGAAKNPSWWRPAEDTTAVAVGGSKIDAVEKEVRDMEREIEEANAHPEENAAFIQQSMEKVAKKKEWLNVHR